MKNNLVILFLLVGLNLYSQNDCHLFKSNIRYLTCDNGYVTSDKFPVNSENRYFRNFNIDFMRIDSMNFYTETCINDFRKEYNCPTLTHLPILDQLAKLQCDYNHDTQQTTHYNAIYGEDVGKRAQYLGITEFSRVGEVCMYRKQNLLEFPYFETLNLEYTRDVFDYYWLSTAHRNCLLNPSYSYYGYYNHYDKETKEHYNVIVVTY